MSNIEQQLAELRQSTLDRLKEIYHEGEKELQDLRVSVLGKKGSLTDL
ncbi:TPA: phenylalanine--tRNA ligase subunit alpha, partial [Streptococcus pneumoniae]|nr:phenylalanine--tRNA ligase subunit alpha [Streptococcus pneumoniae]